eukprot:765827-Hanusia_phi.AAC.2
MLKPSSTDTCPTYFRIRRDVALFKECMTRWLVSRASSTEKKGTKKLEFSCPGMEISSILSLSLVPLNLRTELKVKRRLTCFTWYLNDKIVQDSFFCGILEIPTQACPKRLPNLAAIYLKCPMTLQASSRRGAVRVAVHSVVGLDGFGEIQWTNGPRKVNKQRGMHCE